MRVYIFMYLCVIYRHSTVSRYVTLLVFLAGPFQTWTCFMTCDFWNLLPPTVRPVLSCFFIFAISIPIALLAIVPILRAQDLSRRTSSLSRLALLEIYLLDFFFSENLVPGILLAWHLMDTFPSSTLAASLLRGLCFWPSCQIHRQSSSREWLDVYSLRCTISLALPCLLLLTAQLQARPWSLRVGGKE